MRRSKEVLHWDVIAVQRSVRTRPTDLVGTKAGGGGFVQFSNQYSSGMAVGIVVSIGARQLWGRRPLSVSKQVMIKSS